MPSEEAVTIAGDVWVEVRVDGAAMWPPVQDRRGQAT